MPGKFVNKGYLLHAVYSFLDIPESCPFIVMVFINILFRKMADPRVTQWFMAQDKVSKTHNFLQMLSVISLLGSYWTTGRNTTPTSFEK